MSILVETFPETFEQESKFNDMLHKIMREEGIKVTVMNCHGLPEMLSKLGVYELPAFRINEKTKLQGRMPREEEMVEWFLEEVTGSDKIPKLKDEHNKWPDSLLEAVDRILYYTREEDLSRIGEFTDESFALENGGSWGQGIRNGFGLWLGNNLLMKDCGCDHPDDASLVIMKAVVNRLRNK